MVQYIILTNQINSKELYIASIYSGYKTYSNTSDLQKGSYIMGSTCYAKNPPFGKIYAFARCCNMSQYSVSCTTYQSDLSDTYDDALTYIGCSSSHQTMMGWYVNKYTYMYIVQNLFLCFVSYIKT